jgi:AGZA family xanthine/uracil permease-like MFS transporter
VERGLAAYFRFDERGTTLKREILAGVTTFMTMAYIIFVNPAILSAAGMDFGAVLVATCLASALGTLLMGLYANYPFALAPGMGLNAYFAYSVVIGMGVPWQTALGAVFLSGVAFIVFSAFKVRERIVNAIPNSLKNAIAIGIGLLIAFIGLREGGLVVADPNTFVRLGNLRSPVALLTLFGVLLTAVLMSRQVVGALLIGIITTGVVALATGMVEYQGLVSAPPSLAPTFLKLDIIGALKLGLVTVVVVFLFVDLFDTIGTLVGVSEQAGFIRDGRLPRAGRALFSDAVATTSGALLGTSTVTSYIESVAGVSEGGRTGFANVVTATLFLLALFVSPLAAMVGQGIEVAPGQFLHPVTAPALIIVGSLMVVNVWDIDWRDKTEAIPAFLTMIGMPLTFSIADGMAFGFVSYPVIKLFSGRAREVSLLVYALAVIFVARYWILHS